MAASAKHCRACGAVQEILELEADPSVGLEGAVPGTLDSPEVPPAAHTPPGQPTVKPHAEGYTGTISPRIGHLVGRARRFGEGTLAPRAAAAFPSRSPSDIAVAAIGGGFLAFAVACAVAWALLLMLIEVEGLPLFELARFAVSLALGAPLAGEIEVGDMRARVELDLPLTGFVLVPLAAAVLGGYLAARWFGTRGNSEAWKLGALVGMSFAGTLTVLTALFSAELSLPASLSGTSSDDSSVSDIFGGELLPATVRAAVVQTAVFGCLWGGLGGVIGAWLHVRRPSTPGSLRSSFARTRATGAPLAVLEGAVRALGFALVASAALAAIFIVIESARAEDLRGLFALPVLVPTGALAGVFIAQGVGYEAAGLSARLSEAAASTGDTFHFWDVGASWVLLVLALTAAVVYALARGGRRAAHTSGGVDVREHVRTGALVAIPWVALLVLLRPLASGELTGSGFGLSGALGGVGPVFGETIVLGGLLGALAGAGGGWLAWKEKQGQGGALLSRAFGQIEDSGTPERVQTPRAEVAPSGFAPEPAPHSPVPDSAPRAPAPQPGSQETTPASAQAPSLRSEWSFCDRCGHPVATTDRFCEKCGHVLQAADK